MLLFPEANYQVEIRQKSSSQHQESKIKELLSYSVGEAVKQKMEKPINLSQDYNESKYLAKKNKQSYLQSNIFNDNKVSIRNDKLTINLNKNLKVQSNKPEKLHSEPVKRIIGTLNAEFKKDDIKVDNKQSQQSVIFNTLDKYYKDFKPSKNPHFMASGLKFFQHDSQRDKKIEEHERQLEKLYQEQKIKDDQAIKSQNNSRKHSKQVTEIIIKPEKVEIPIQQKQGYEITIDQKGNGFLTTQFQSIIKHNGFCIKSQEKDHYVLQPNGCDYNIFSIQKYLKDYDNKATIKKIPYQDVQK